MLIRGVILTVLAAVLTYTWADPDLWGHVLFGGDIVRDGEIARSDPYSFTSDVEWVNHEWLAEVAMYGSYALAGGVGLVALKIVLVFGAIGVVFVTLRRYPIPPVARDVLLGLAVAGANARLSAVRPQLFSLILFAALLAMLLQVDKGRSRWLLALPIVMTLWVNVHGGWLVGLGTIGLWGAFRLLSPPTGVGRGLLSVVLVTSVLATLVNPYGVELWEFLASTVRLGRPDIEEWRPITAFPRLLIPWTIAGGLTAVAAYRTWPILPWAYLTLVAGLGFASFRVSRLDAFFTFAVVMLLAPEIGRLWKDDGRHRPLDTTPRSAVLAISGVAWLAIVGAGVAALVNLSCVRMNDDGLPEPEAAAFIRQNDLRGRMITWFDWGEYAIWHFAPDIQVSMDGRRETIYSPTQVEGHLNLYFDLPGGLDYARSLNADYAWLPKNLRAVPALLDDGWHPIYESSQSILLATRPHPHVRRPESLSLDRRCFPGP